MERAMRMKGLSWPLWSQKLKVTFHQFLLIGLFDKKKQV